MTHQQEERPQSRVPDCERLRRIAREEFRRAGYRTGQRVPASELDAVLCRASRRLLEECIADPRRRPLR